MEDDIFHRIVIDLRPEHWQKARPPLGGIFAKINRQLHEKIQRQAKLNKLAAVPKTKWIPSFFFLPTNWKKCNHQDLKTPNFDMKNQKIQQLFIQN